MFSAASNVTGIITDDISISVLLHRYGALAFWDYAAAGPYVKIDMNPLNIGYVLHFYSKKCICYGYTFQFKILCAIHCKYFKIECMLTFNNLQFQKVAISGVGCTLPALRLKK